jgi:hypothetical protein
LFLFKIHGIWHSTNKPLKTYIQLMKQFSLTDLVLHIFPEAVVHILLIPGWFEGMAPLAFVPDNWLGGVQQTTGQQLAAAD